MNDECVSGMKYDHDSRYRIKEKDLTGGRETPRPDFFPLFITHHLNNDHVPVDCARIVHVHVTISGICLAWNE